MCCFTGPSSPVHNDKTLQGDVYLISHQLRTTQLNLTPMSFAFNTQVRRVSFTFSPLLCPLTYTSQFKAPQKLLTLLFVPALQNFLSPSKHQRQPGNMLDNLPQGRCFFYFFFVTIKPIVCNIFSTALLHAFKVDVE